ncbi:MAG: universal stress protein, partial [Planctomycetales bacterium]|nr:universal stress protein [Planctomycetales bacterium]
MKKFQNILVVVDSSQSTHSALERAMKLAGQGGGKLHLIEVVKDAGLALRWLSRDYVHIHELLVRERQQGLQGLLELCKSHGIDATGEVLEGVSSQVTIDTVQRIGAQLVIREAKGERSLATGSLGTSAMKLIRR